MDHKKRLIRNSIILVALILALCLVIEIAFFAGNLRPKNVAADSSSVYFRVEKGMGFTAIAGQLYSEGIIKSKFAFETYAFLSGKSSSFKPGAYYLASSQSVPEIASALLAGPQAIKAVITPGMTIKGIDEYLSSLKIINPNSLINFNVNSIKNKYPILDNAPYVSTDKQSLEGFLFPDTYSFFAGSDAGTVVEKMLDNFIQKTNQLLSNDQKNNFDWLITASILEKEVVSENDLRIVAGIIQNRLAKKMPLQIDATVIYAKCREFINCPSLSQDDFKIDSPYNTYKYAGLPPGPISNPGIEAIKAALNPQKTGYMFYLSDPITKKTIFSRTLDEHVQNRRKYLPSN